MNYSELEPDSYFAINSASNLDSFPESESEFSSVFYESRHLYFF